MTPIHIPNWLMHPELWRFVGFASSVVGLLCYALSSSFNHLFGEWNLPKIFLYSALSLVVCGTLLFAKQWQLSTSLLFKAHMGVLLLALTSVYSFFYDKTVNGKPDALSLISSAAFALMSLSLSRQTHLGCEVDLLYFFLGCLIVQLMKIQLLLGLVGAAFSYSLMLLRSSLDSQLQNGNAGLHDHVVIQMDASSNGSILVSPQQTDSALIMHQLMASTEALQHNSDLLDKLLEQVDLFGYDVVIDTLPSDTVDELHEIAESMVAAGFGIECSREYSGCRREFLEESLSRFGLQKLSIEDVHTMPWHDLEDEIERWIKASNVALRILFPSERRLCDRVFFGFSSVADLSFVDVCRGSTIQLLNFADAIGNGSSSPERFFRILDVFETLRDLIPEFESLFSDHYSVFLRNEAITVWKRLGEAIRGIFLELENLIHGDLAKAAVPVGGLHPTTRCLMNYLRASCWSRQALEQVFEDYGHPLK